MCIMGKKLCILPLFDNQQTFEDIIARVAWHIHFLGIKKIMVFGTEISKDIKDFSLSEKFDPTIRECVKKIWPSIKFYEEIQGSITVLFQETDYVLCYTKEDFDSIMDTLPDDVMMKKKLLNISPEDSYEFYGGYLLVIENISNNKDELISLNHKKFEKILSGKRSKKAYVFGSGPSLSQYKKYDYSDSVSIICNSIIFDKEFVEHVNPDVLIFADAVYFCGPSYYSYYFRYSLRELFRRKKIIIIVPLLIYNMLIACMPELEEYMIGIPLHASLEFDLKKEFMLPKLIHVAPMVIIPLASYLSNQIFLLGFDGRKDSSEIDDHWRYYKVIDEEWMVKNLRLVHPGFFKRTWEAEYERYCSLMKTAVECARNLGCSFHCLETSNIPVFKENL